MLTLSSTVPFITVLSSLAAPWTTINTLSIQILCTNTHNPMLLSSAYPPQQNGLQLDPCGCFHLSFPLKDKSFITSKLGLKSSLGTISSLGPTSAQNCLYSLPMPIEGRVLHTLKCKSHICKSVKAWHMHPFYGEHYVSAQNCNTQNKNSPERPLSTASVLNHQLSLLSCVSQTLGWMQED